MPQNSEVELFLQRVSALPNDPGTSLDDLLKPAIEIERELWTLFVTDKSHERLTDAHVGLVDVFDAPDSIRTTRARLADDEDLSARYIMPLTQENRRIEGPCMLKDLSDFKKNWDVFTEGSLSRLDWNNVVAAGGAVLACLLPLPEAAKGSRRNMRKHHHAAAYPSSDIDLFLWGLSLDETENKIKEIYEAVREAIPHDVTCVRTKNTVSIISQYPYRSVQIILRQYSSPAEVLVGFDVDAGCCLYDGSRVYANPRAIVAMMRQANTIDPSRRSSSYEVRLTKYAARGFEVYYPDLRREDIDPTIYERSLRRVEGLARLLVLEKFANSDVRYTFLDSRRTLRGRPNPLRKYNKRNRRLIGDLKAELSLVDMSEYDVLSLHIPYGQGWDARRIDKLVYQTDLSMNSTFNPKNKERRLHRHPAFFGTAEECMEDCCGTCPEPIDEDEHKAQEEEDQYYIRGRISFIPISYGRKSLPGTLKAVDEAEWIAQAYFGPTEKLFTAIAACDREAVSNLFVEVDLNRRDYVGRTPLHMAILSGAPDIACDLVHAGARITAQMVDGRTSLHLAAQLDQLEVVRTVLERSAINEQAVDNEETLHEGDSTASSSRPSSEDDWSSEDDKADLTKKKRVAIVRAKPLINGGDIPEDDDLPDVFDVNGVDWDLNFTPLCHAILFSSPAVVQALLNAGADATFVSLTNDQLAVLPLALTILIEDEDRACQIAEQLVSAGASSSAANERGTIFHRAVAANRCKLAATFLRCDPNAMEALNFPMFASGGAMSPLVTAVHNQNYRMLAVLLAHGAKVATPQEEIDRAAGTRNPRPYYHDHTRSDTKYHPVETALALQDDFALLMVSLGGQVDFTVGPPSDSFNPRPQGEKLKLLQWIERAIFSVSQVDFPDKPPRPSTEVTNAEAPPSTKWSKYLTDILLGTKQTNEWPWPQWTDDQWSEYMKSEKIRLGALKDYFISVSKSISGYDALQLTALAPVTSDSQTSFPIPADGERRAKYHRLLPPPTHSVFGFDPYSNGVSPAYLDGLYDDLFEACFAGSNEKIHQMFIAGAITTIDTSIFYVSVQVADPHGTGITPLVAAIAGRHWDTARLIMTVAGLQYKSAEQLPRFTTVGIRLDEDDHNYGDGSDVTVDEAVTKFVDIAKKSTTAQCNVPSGVLLSTPISWLNKNGWSEKGSPLVKAVYDNDFEAFVNIANLYKYSTPRVNLDADSSLLRTIFAKDRTEMLDEYIRRTGLGVDVPDAGETDLEDFVAVNNKNKIYTGLSVHGQKRLDLARQNDPNIFPVVEKQTVPLVWQAATAGACDIVDYLAGDRPLAAYRFYALSNSDARARDLRRLPDLGKLLPELLGWTITPLCETPLFAGIQSQNLALVKKLIYKSPHVVASALHERVKGLGVNAVMFAIYMNCDTDLVDFLLGQSISPAVLDETNGFNIFHYMCQKNHIELLQHLLYKLSREVVEALLSQQSKELLQTPMHIAVQKGNTEIVHAVLEFSTVGLHLRDAYGWTALHTAVQRGIPAIIGRLIDAAPAGLGVENGVGHTPLEIAFLQDLIARTQAYKRVRAPSSREAKKDEPVWLPPPTVQSLRGWCPRAPRCPVDAPALRDTLVRLVQEGTLHADSTLGTQLFAFADKLEAKQAAEQGSKDDVTATPGDVPRVWQESDGPYADPYDEKFKSRPPTLATVHAGVARYAPVARQLVHLAEVQASVETSLARANRGTANSRGRAYDHTHWGLKGSLVYRKMHMELEGNGFPFGPLFGSENPDYYPQPHENLYT